MISFLKTSFVLASTVEANLSGVYGLLSCFPLTEKKQITPLSMASIVETEMSKSFKETNHSLVAQKYNLIKNDIINKHIYQICNNICTQIVMSITI